jgi:hypothetical protein
MSLMTALSLFKDISWSKILRGEFLPFLYICSMGYIEQKSGLKNRGHHARFFTISLFQGPLLCMSLKNDIQTIKINNCNKRQEIYIKVMISSSNYIY